MLTKDTRIRYRPLEKEALINAEVAAFVVTGGNLTGDEMATIFVKAMPKIERVLSEQKRPFIARITRGGTVSVLFTPSRSL